MWSSPEALFPFLALSQDATHRVSVRRNLSVEAHSFVGLQEFHKYHVGTDNRAVDGILEIRRTRRQQWSAPIEMSAVEGEATYECGLTLNRIPNRLVHTDGYVERRSKNGSFGGEECSAGCKSAAWYAT